MSENTTEAALPRTQSVINRSAVKSYALVISRERRARKFTRVSEEFLNAVEADVEAVIRQLTIANVDPQSASRVAPDDDRLFITGAALDKFKVKLNERTQQIIAGRVMRHPSIGCTLKD